MNGPVMTENTTENNTKSSSLIIPPIPDSVPPSPPVSIPFYKKSRPKPVSQPTAVPSMSVSTSTSSVVAVSLNSAPTSVPPSVISTSTSVPTQTPLTTPVKPEKTYLDARETIYTFFSTSDSGSFPIYATNDDSLWGRGSFLNGERNGPWVQYYNSNPDLIKKREYYVDGEKHGDFSYYYENEAHSLHISVSYEHGKKDGYFYEYQKNGQLLLSVLYEQGVERKRVEFFESGYMKRIVSRKKYPVLATIEFRPNGQVLYIGESRRERRDGGYHYICHGTGTYYYDLFAELSGEFRKGFYIWKGKEVSIVDCLGVVKKSPKGSFYIKELPDGTILPWKLFLNKVKEDGSVSAIIGGRERVIKTCAVIKDGNEEYTERCILSILGYPVVLTLSQGSSMKRIEFYPFFGEKDEVTVGKVKMSAVVEGAIRERAACNVKVYSKSKLVSEVRYLNTGEKLPSV